MTLNTGRNAFLAIMCASTMNLAIAAGSNELQEVKGQVLLNSDGKYISIGRDQSVADGDRLMLMERSSVTISFSSPEGSCVKEYVGPAIVDVDSADCAMNEEGVLLARHEKSSSYFGRLSNEQVGAAVMSSAVVGGAVLRGNPTTRGPFCCIDRRPSP